MSLKDTRSSNLLKLKEYSTGSGSDKQDPILPTKLLSDLQDILTQTGGTTDYRLSFWADKSSPFVTSMLTMLYQIEAFHRLSLYLLEGEYLELLQTPKKGDTADYLEGLDDFSRKTTIQDFMEYEFFSAKRGSLLELSFSKSIHETYLEYDRRSDMLTALIADNLRGFLASIEAHYHFTQVENRGVGTTSTAYLEKFSKNEHPLNSLYNLFRLTLQVTHEDHFLSADHRCLGQLVNCRASLQKLLKSRKEEQEQEQEEQQEPQPEKEKEYERDRLPIEHHIKDILVEDILGVFHGDLANFRTPFYRALNTLIADKFNPVVQALLEKINFLIRKLLIRHGYRGIKDAQMMQLDDQRIPLIFVNRQLVNFSYEDYQLSYHLFKWEQRVKYNYSHTQTFVELEGYKIGVYRTLLYKGEEKCRASYLNSHDIYHYCSRYFRDFEPSPEHLERLFHSFREHVYLPMREMRTSEKRTVKFLRGGLDVFNQQNWLAVRHMYNYLYYSTLFLKLSGSYGVPAKLGEAREWMTEVRLIQEETGIFNYYPYYTYAHYLLRQIKYLVAEDGKNKEVSDLYIQLRETITTCENYFMVCKKNGFISFHMPVEECYPYKSSGINSITMRIPQKVSYVIAEGETTKWEKKYENVNLFIASTHALPTSYDGYSRRIDELKAEVENIALSQVTQLNERIRADTKTLKEDLFKTFGWFTGIVSFVVGGIFKLSGSNNQSLYGTILFMASFGICLMVFIFALFGLTKEKSPLWNRLFTFLESKAEFTVDGTRQTTLTRVVRDSFRNFNYVVASFYTWLFTLMQQGFSVYEKEPNEFQKALSKVEQKLDRITKEIGKGEAKPAIKIAVHWVLSSLLALVLFPIGLVMLAIRIIYVLFRYWILLMVRVFKYVSAGGSLWRAMFFLSLFVVIFLFFKDMVRQEELVKDKYKDSLLNEVKVEMVRYKDSLDADTAK